MKLTFAAIAKIHVVHEGSTTELRGIDFELGLDGRLDESQYRNKDSNLTKAGVQSVTNCFVHGLAGVIKYAHAAGIRDESDHMRYIIEELNRAFVTDAKINLPT